MNNVCNLEYNNFNFFKDDFNNEIQKIDELKYKCVSKIYDDLLNYKLKNIHLYVLFFFMKSFNNNKFIVNSKIIKNIDINFLSKIKLISNVDRTNIIDIGNVSNIIDNLEVEINKILKILKIDIINNHMIIFFFLKNYEEETFIDIDLKKKTNTNKIKENYINFINKEIKLNLNINNFKNKFKNKNFINKICENKLTLIYLFQNDLINEIFCELKNENENIKLNNLYTKINNKCLKVKNIITNEINISKNLNLFIEKIKKKFNKIILIENNILPNLIKNSIFENITQHIIICKKYKDIKKKINEHKYLRIKGEIYIKQNINKTNKKRKRQKEKEFQEDLQSEKQKEKKFQEDPQSEKQKEKESQEDLQSEKQKEKEFQEDPKVDRQKEKESQEDPKSDRQKEKQKQKQLLRTDIVYKILKYTKVKLNLKELCIITYLYNFKNIPLIFFESIQLLSNMLKHEQKYNHKQLPFKLKKHEYKDIIKVVNIYKKNYNILLPKKYIKNIFNNKTKHLTKKLTYILNTKNIKNIYSEKIKGKGHISYFYYKHKKKNKI